MPSNTLATWLMIQLPALPHPSACLVRVQNTCNSWARTRGAQLQLGTLSTRIALYTRRWRASLGVLTHADYTLGAVAPLLACLRTAHILGPGGLLPHAKNEVDRTTRSGDTAKRRADRQTDMTYQLTRHPDTRTASRPFCQYPAVAGKNKNAF